MAYGIAFDIDTNCHKDFMKEKFSELDEIEVLKNLSQDKLIYKEPKP